MSGPPAAGERIDISLVQRMTHHTTHHTTHHMTHRMTHHTTHHMTRHTSVRATLRNGGLRRRGTRHQSDHWQCCAPHAPVRPLAVLCSTRPSQTTGSAVLHAHAPVRPLAVLCSTRTSQTTGSAVLHTHQSDHWQCCAPHAPARPPRSSIDLTARGIISYHTSTGSCIPLDSTHVQQ